MHYIETVYLWCQYDNLFYREMVLDFNVYNEILYSQFFVSSIIYSHILLVIDDISLIRCNQITSWGLNKKYQDAFFFN